MHYRLSAFLLVVFAVCTLAACENDTSVMKPAIAKLVTDADSASKNGEIATARCRLQSALTLQPENTKVAYNLAVLETQEKHWADAIVYYQAVLKTEPGSIDAQYGLTVAAHSEGQDLLSKSAVNEHKDYTDEANAMFQICFDSASRFMEEAPQGDTGRTEIEPVYTECKLALERAK